MTLARDLLEAEWGARRRPYVTLLALFAATSAAFLVGLGLLGGLESRIGAELSDNLAGDVRVTLGAHGVADGQIIPEARDVVDGILAADPHARVAQRLEAEGLFLRNAGFTTNRPDGPGVSRSAAILLGVDAQDGDFGPDAYLVEGVGLARASSTLDPSGEPVVPLVVGRDFLATSNVTVAHGAPGWGSVLNATAGKTENGKLVSVRCAVVGIYSTGFRMIDRVAVFLPRGEVARLLGHHPDAPPANAILVRTARASDVAGAARTHGLDAMGEQAFRESYFGPVFRVTRAVAWGALVALSAAMAAWFGYTLSHHVREDRQKIATLRAIGIPVAALRRTYATVAALLGWGGALLGAIVALALFLAVASLSPLVAAGPALVPRVGWLDGALIVALLGTSALGAALVALRRAFRGNLYEALRGA